MGMFRLISCGLSMQYCYSHHGVLWINTDDCLYFIILIFRMECHARMYIMWRVCDIQFIFSVAGASCWFLCSIQPCDPFTPVAHCFGKRAHHFVTCRCWRGCDNTTEPCLKHAGDEWIQSLIPTIYSDAWYGGLHAALVPLHSNIMSKTYSNMLHHTATQCRA